MSIRVGGGSADLPGHQKPHRSVSILPNPIGHHYNRHRLEDRDRDWSPRGRANTRHNKSCTHRKSSNIQSTAGVPAPENSQVPQCDMIVGMVGMLWVNKRKPCDPRAFAAFSGFGLILLEDGLGMAW